MYLLKYHLETAIYTVICTFVDFWYNHEDIMPKAKVKNEGEGGVEDEFTEIQL